MNEFEIAFQKALMFLDRGDLEAGEELLRKALRLAEEAGDELGQARAACCLGDLLYEQGHTEEAGVLLQRVLAFPREDDLLDYEVSRAREILAEISA